MSAGAINGTSATGMRWHVGDWGAWWVDVSLAEPLALARGAQVSATIAEVTGECTVVSGGVFDGKSAYRLVAGRGAWGKTIPRKPYMNDAGVKVSGIISDAAREAGEIIDSPPTSKVASHYVRDEGPANRVLHTLAPQAWRVDFDGVTRFGKRPTVAYSGDGTRTRIAPDASIVEIATETIGALVPGVTVDGSLPATDVEYELNASRLTVRVYAGRSSSRRLLAIKRIIDALYPDLKWRGSYEFRVVEQVGNRFNLQPVRVASGMPDLENVPARGHAGVRSQVTPGDLVMVTFADADPSRPFIFAHDEIDAPGWMPLFLQLGEEPTLGVARLTDAVVAGGFGGAITFASSRIKAGL